MLLATTNRACQDVAAIPFLWIIPLGLYLLSFIICFDHGRWYRRGAFAGGALASILAVAGMSVISDRFDAYGVPFTFVHEITLYFSALFFICMVCHGELMRQRPGTLHLTEYYLMIAAGGAVGGIFVSLISPLIFSTYSEWEIGLALSSMIAAWILIGLANPWQKSLPWLTPAGAAIAAAGLGCVLFWKEAGEPPIAVTRNSLRGRVGLGSRPPRPGASPVHVDAWPDSPRECNSPTLTNAARPRRPITAKRKRRRAGLDLPS